MFFKYFKLKKSRKKAVPIVSRIIQDAEKTAPQRFTGASQDESERIAKFEIIALHTIAVLWVLKKFPEAKLLAQAIHDELFDRFDSALREQGIADIRIGPEVRKLASAFHGRLESYTSAWEKGDDQAFKEALHRNAVTEDAAESEKLAEKTYMYIQEVNKNSLDEVLSVLLDDMTPELKEAS